MADQHHSEPRSSPHFRDARLEARQYVAADGDPVQYVAMLAKV